MLLILLVGWVIGRELELDGPAIAVDQTVVDECERTLAPGLADLNTLDNLPGLDADGPAQIYPCEIDSGALNDLGAGRSCTAVVPGRGVDTVDPSVSVETAKGFRALIRQLVAADWTVSGRETLLRMELPPGFAFDTVDLKRIIGGSELWLSVQAWDDGVSGYMDFEGAQNACRLG